MKGKNKNKPKLLPTKKLARNKKRKLLMLSVKLMKMLA